MSRAMGIIMQTDAAVQTGGIDEAINRVVQPLTDILSSFIFYSVRIGEAELPLIVLWLIIGAVFFTAYLGFINLRGFAHALRIVSGKDGETTGDGEISHFQALTAAVSGTVGIGNIAGVAITISIGGAGAIFWLIMAGLVGMTTKFVECTLGVKYREVAADGTVSGGPMYYLQRGLAKRGWPKFGRFLGLFYAVSIVIGCLGIGNMFQSNQAYEQLLFVTGGADGPLAGRGWLVGIALAVIVGVVIIGGIKSIARVTVKLVPFMIGLYIIGALVVIAMNASAVPGAIIAIVTGAFSPSGVAGGFLGVMIIGFQRAAFSNEAGIGSAAIAHSAVQTSDPLTEGFVSLLEPFIDTVVICTLTGLVIVTAFPEDQLMSGGMAGIEMTSAAFAGTLPWSPVPLAVAAILFAVSTMLAWAYYGTKGWTYVFGESPAMRTTFSLIFCAFIALGAAVQLGAILDFADALIFVMAIPNLIGLYIMAPEVKADLKVYWDARKRG